MRHEVTLGGEKVTIQDFSPRKAFVVTHSLRSVLQKAPEIRARISEFARDYENENVLLIDRATARRQFAPQPLYELEPVILGGQAVLDEISGEPLVKRTPKLDEDNRPILGPDPLAHITEEDWAASDHKLRIGKAPSAEEIAIEVLPHAMEFAEDEVMKFFAALVMSNGDIKRARREGRLGDVLAEKAEELGDETTLDEIMELFVVAAEVVEDQIGSKMTELRQRLGNALAVFGIGPKAGTTTTSSSRPTSTPQSSSTSPEPSTDSPPDTDGPSETPSTESPGLASSPSAS